MIIYEFLYGIPAFHAETPHLVFENILARRLNWQEDDFDISPEAIDLMNGLMCTTISNRLGTAEERSVKTHPFFSKIDWDKVLDIKGEFIPNVKNATDTEYFDDRGVQNQEFSKEDEKDMNRADIFEDTSLSADFGEQVYKNLPLLEKANNDLIEKLRSEGYNEGMS